MNDVNVYLVSPPTLYMPTGGAAFCLISNNESWQNEVINLIEKGINKSQLTFYANNNEHIDPKSWIWYWHVAKNCDLIICDTAHCTPHELNMCLAMLKDGLPVIFCVPSTNEELKMLLNCLSVGHYDTVEELDTMLEAIFNG